MRLSLLCRSLLPGVNMASAAGRAGRMRNRAADPRTRRPRGRGGTPGETGGRVTTAGRTGP